MSKAFASSMTMDEGNDEFPSLRNGGGGGGGEESRSKGPRNKNKNTRGRQNLNKPNPGMKSKEHTPAPEEKENHEEKAEPFKSERNDQQDDLRNSVVSPIPALDTTEEHFVTANNSAEESHNGYGDSFSTSMKLKDEKKDEEDAVNSNHTTSTTAETPNATLRSPNVTDSADDSVENNNHVDLSILEPKNNREDDMDVSNASLAVQLSDTAGDTLDLLSFAAEPSQDNSVLDSPLSSSRSAPAELSNIQNLSLQNATDSIIYPPHQSHFQTSTPIFPNAAGRRNIGGSTGSMNYTTGGDGPVGEWDSTIFAEDPSNVLRANTGFAAYSDDSAPQNSDLGFTRDESGICDMFAGKDQQSGSTTEESAEAEEVSALAPLAEAVASAPLEETPFGTPATSTVTQSSPAEHVTSTSLEKSLGRAPLAEAVALAPSPEVAAMAKLAESVAMAPLNLEENAFVKASEETQAHAEVPISAPSSKSVTFQDPLHNTNDSASEDTDGEVEEINKPFMLPSTVTMLTADNGVKVYLVGTAHFSRESQLDVIQTIQQVQPSGVLLELCHSRSGMLTMDEEQIMKEASDMSLAKIKSTIRQSGPVQGCLHLLLLSMTASLTKKLGMAPGGEFRVALHEAKKIPGCTVHLGDRNLAVTLNRALSGLSVFQKMKLAWHFLRASDTDITKEEVEACKEKDLLEKLLLEMAGEFPSMSRVLLDERDLFLAHSLWFAATAIRMDRYGHTEPNEGPVVGVVGMGHVAGIVKNWGKVTEEKIAEIVQVPEPPLSSIIVRKAVKYSFYAILGYGVYKGSRKLFNFPSDALIGKSIERAHSAFQKISPEQFSGR